MCQSKVGGTRVCCGALERQRLRQGLKCHFLSIVSAGSIFSQPGYSNCCTRHILRIGTGDSGLLHPCDPSPTESAPSTWISGISISTSAGRTRTQAPLREYDAPTALAFCALQLLWDCH
ncbi:hypothetical protein QQF64_008303 [Cirrhinus molitorella]|uniref:Uncharacterized protein n=1 Tax=Cirrhinus molitorella TaxID=172907 RepID=A0ABR3M848_9TELE